MDKLAQRRAKLFARVSKDPQRARVSFRRFWRSAHKPKLPRWEQRRSAMALWKAVGKKPLGKTKQRGKQDGASS